jgi:hypothetical protein
MGDFLGRKVASRPIAVAAGEGSEDFVPAGSNRGSDWL